MTDKPGRKTKDPPERKSLSGRSQRVLEYLTPGLAGLAAVFCLFVLIQWVSGYFRRVGGNLASVPMAPLTAILFLLTATALFFQRRKTVSQPIALCIGIIAGLIILISLLVLAQFLNLLPTDIESSLTGAATSKSGFIIGRISPITAGLFIVVSASLLISNAGVKSHKLTLLADSLSLAVLATAGAITLGYWYRAPLFYGGTTIPVALLTGVGFLLMSAAQLFSTPESFFRRFLVSTSVAAQICRAIIPIFVIGRLALPYIEGSIRNLVSPSLASTVSLGSTLVISVTIVIVLWLVSRRIDSRIAHNESALRASEGKYRTLVDNSLVGVYRSSLKGDFLYANDAAIKMFGFDSADEIMARGIPARHKNPADWAILISELQQNGKVDGLEMELATMAGEVRNILTSATLEGDIISGMVVDITERKQADERFRSIFDASVDGILLADPETRHLFMGNRALCQMIGYTNDEIKNLSIANIHLEEDLPRILKDFEAQAKGLVKLTQDVPLKKRDGSIIYVDIKSSQVKITGKNYLAGIFRDSTERRSAEDALSESERLYRSLFENMLNGFAYCKMLFKEDKPYDFIYLSVNDAFENLTGLKNVIGKKVTEIIPGILEDNPELFEIYGRVASTRKPERFETFVPGLEMWFSISVYSPAKEYFVAVFDVITERKKAEEQLRTAEENFRNSQDESPLGIRIVTSNGELLYANKAILNIYGYSSVDKLRATPAEERYTAESYSEHLQRRELRRQGKPVPPDYEISIVRKDGSIRRLSVSRKEVTWNGEIQFQVIYQDITGRKLERRN